MRSVVFGNVQPDAVIRNEERFDCPIAAVALMPDGSSILEFDKGLQVRGAIATGAKILPADIRQVQEFGSSLSDAILTKYFDLLELSVITKHAQAIAQNLKYAVRA